MDTKGSEARPNPDTLPVSPPGRAVELKLLSEATGGSLMIFEQTLPTGSKSSFHLHHDSDEVAYVISGEVTFVIGDAVSVAGPGGCAFMPRGVPHAWKSTGTATARVLFLYTPAKAGGLLEEQQRTQRKFASMTEREMAEICQRHGWEILGPSPL